MILGEVEERVPERVESILCSGVDCRYLAGRPVNEEHLNAVCGSIPKERDVEVARLASVELHEAINHLKLGVVSDHVVFPFGS
jgi:hypothetical protein